MIGDLSEWLKERAWKVRKLQKGFKSSNLLVSAKMCKRLIIKVLSNVFCINFKLFEK